MKNLLLTLFAVLLLTGCAPVETQQAEDLTSSPTETEEETSVEEPVEEPEAGDEDTEEGEPEVSVEEPEQEMAQSVKEFDMVASKWDFEPSTIIINEGDTVLLHIQSTDVAHGFGLTAFGINEYLNPGESIDVEFVADKTGTFQYVCSVYCGSGHSNMKGWLIVE